MRKIYLFVAIFLAVVVAPVYAQDVGPAPAQLGDIVSIIGKGIALLAPAAGIAFFIMLLVGGWQFITSGGDPKSAASARNTLTYAIIGVILVVAAWLILTLIEVITQTNITTINWPVN